MPAQNLKSNLTLRVVTRLANSSWRVLSVKRGLALYQGREIAPGWANQSIEVVSAHILTDTKPQRLESASKAVWTFDQHGRIDSDQVMAELVKKLDTSAVDRQDQSETHLSQTELEEICAVLRVQLPD